jgi:nucleoid-associated protein YgaU
VRKWTSSACVVLAWCIMPLLAVAGSQESGLAQANTSTATSISISTAASASTAASIRTVASASTTARASTAGDTRVVRASQSVTAVNAEVIAGRGPRPAATWTVRPGDTLSAIATALGVPGGWQALYAANRRAIGPDPDLIRPGAVLTVPGRQGPARYTVAPGDTLSAIAAALGVPGGWQALYAANRRAIGPDPDLIRPGTVLTAPRPAALGQPSQPAVPAPARTRQQAPPRHQSPAPPSSRPPRPRHQSPAPASAGRQPASRGTTPGHATAPAAAAGGMPRWLQDLLLAVGVLAATAFAAEPAAALARRRRGPPRVRRVPGAAPRRAQRAADKTRIILADHERLIVTYCAHDNAVYVLTPPGEDPRAVLKAARLVLPEDTYEDLAGHLGVSSAWPLE